MPETNRVTVTDIVAAKHERRRVAVLTAYDCWQARILDAAGVDIILVGDSLGNVVLGYDTTLPVTMEDMVRHTAAVARGTERALLVADMPFMSYQASRKAALRNAGRLLKEGMATAVKLEGGVSRAALVAAMVDAGIPVMGHVGLTPQSVHRFGGYRVQGRDEVSAERIAADARALADAGAFAIVLEMVPSALAARITSEVPVPTIGIGAGPACDGQVLVLHDLLGLYRGFRPKFVKVYDDLGARMEAAVRGYVVDVQEGNFPDGEHSY